MANDWKEMFRTEAEVGQLAIALNIAHSHEMTEDEKGMLRRLILNAPDCTARRIFRAISMLIPADASGEEINNAIGKIVRILNAQMFRDSSWWNTVIALKEFDSFRSSGRVN